MCGQNSLYKKEDATLRHASNNPEKTEGGLPKGKKRGPSYFLSKRTGRVTGAAERTKLFGEGGREVSRDENPNLVFYSGQV